MKRPSGFYRVKEISEWGGAWTIARYDERRDVWASMGEGGDCNDEDWDEIESSSIEMPVSSQEPEPCVDLSPSSN